MRAADEAARVEALLCAVPEGGLTVVRTSPAGQEQILLTDQFSARTAGKGRLEVCTPLPGVDASYDLVLAPEVAIRHTADPAVLELFYCRRGRVGWNMRGGLAVYLGAGDLALHSAACCADSAMMFPLGYAEGLSLSIHLPTLEARCPQALREGGVDFGAIRRNFCGRQPAVLPACPELEEMFAPLYAAKPSRRRAYLRLKIQELLLYLMDVPPEKTAPAPCLSRQTEQIREIHRQLTDHLDRRYTIEELSRQYLLNTSALKEGFKAVYGLPVATYMKEYRVRRAMELLRESDAPISEIARQVGYETQGKFSKAFRDVAGLLPSEYRRAHGSS